MRWATSGEGGSARQVDSRHPGQLGQGVYHHGGRHHAAADEEGTKRLVGLGGLAQQGRDDLSLTRSRPGSGALARRRDHSVRLARAPGSYDHPQHLFEGRLALHRLQQAVQAEGPHALLACLRVRC